MSKMIIITIYVVFRYFGDYDEKINGPAFPK
jgi:hypothetical protein